MRDNNEIFNCIEDNKSVDNLKLEDSLDFFRIASDDSIEEGGKKVLFVIRCEIHIHDNVKSCSMNLVIFRNK